MLATLAIAVLLLGVSALPQQAIPDPRVTDVLTRSFTSFSAAAREAGLSRIYAGVHTRLDHRAGLRLGFDVAHFVLDNALLPARGSAN